MLIFANDESVRELSGSSGQSCRSLLHRGGSQRLCLFPDTIIRAIQEAGGKPMYQEFIGGDHNQCADHADAKPELYDWLLLKDRARR
jgi:hypothetical protein